MTSSRLIAVVGLVALFAAGDAQAQRRPKPAPKHNRTKTTQPRAEPTAPRPPPTAPTTQPPNPSGSTTEPASPPELSTAALRAAPPAKDARPGDPARDIQPPAPASTAEQPRDRASKDVAPRPLTTLLPLAIVGIEPRWEARYFRHTEFTSPNVRSYTANGYAAFALSAELFPLANVSATFWRGFGVTFGYTQAVGLQSGSRRLGDLAGVQSVPVDTHFSRYTAGLRYRVAVNAESSVPIVLATSVSFCGWKFDFASELPRGPDFETPIADYEMVRFGVDAGVSLLPFTFFTALSYLHAFSIGAPSSRELAALQFPHLATAQGMGGEIRAALGAIVWRQIELRLSAEYAALAFHLAPIQGRNDQAALVVDSYVSVGFGAHVHF